MTAISNPRTAAVNSGGTLVNATSYPYPCMVHSIHVAHATGGAAWIQIHNHAGTPAEGAVPRFVHAIETSKNDAKIEGDSFPIYFDQGVYICESDTVATKTLHAGVDLFVVMVIEAP